ncbi:hypothetical protein JXA32_17815 [Candidatus Sumerlaeota bacterium]|nr:hypothetical protein [Candidatus Sumerlaeota bacterium]
MIEINLLPDDMRKGGRAKSSKPVKAKTAPGTGISPLVPFVFLLMLAGTAVAGYMMLIDYYQKKVEVKAIVDKELQLSNDVKRRQNELKDLERLETEVNTRLKILQSLDPEDRLFWAEKLNIISDLRLENIYLEKIELTEEVEDVETPESQLRRAEWQRARQRDANSVPRAEPRKETRPKIEQTLVLHGICEPEDPNREGWAPTAIQTFRRYLDLLKTHEVTEDVSVEYQLRPFASNLAYIAPGVNLDATAEIQKHKVLRFQIVLKTLPILKYVDPGSGGAGGAE